MADNVVIKLMFEKVIGESSCISTDQESEKEPVITCDLKSPSVPILMNTPNAEQYS